MFDQLRCVVGNLSGPNNPLVGIEKRTVIGL